MTQDQKAIALKEIKRLIFSYEDLKKTGKYDTFNEDETCRKLILPLFAALGWDTEGKNIIDEVTGQEMAGGQKRVDYSFNINSSPVLYLEAKKLSEDLSDTRFADQIINYGYSKSVKWVVLTDFEGVMVFNALLKAKRLSEKTIINLKVNEFIDKIDILWLLSKESIVSGKLNEYAKEKGHVEHKVPINELLLSKLLVWRDRLARQIAGDNSGLTKEDVAECVQKYLNRLIFIRTCEDRGIDKKNLLMNLTKEWQNDTTKRLHKMLQETFRDFDEGYNSSLFEPHEVDKLKLNDDYLFDIIHGLYEDSKEDVSFDFSAIDADILGSIYEQYLGTIQKEHGEKTKRKSQGIYYTPKYIVDYIVKNTLGKVTDDLIKNKEYSKIGKLKVLDPACGSGSFLLKALQIFDEAYAKTPEEKEYPKMRKIKALGSNIYGVDLDEEAAELTKLNLLLSAVSARKKLPNLDHNIECGNSLIDDPKVAGDKVFDWEKRFPEIMDKGGFDIIIGNPPYIRNRELPDNIKTYFEREYNTASGQYDIYQLFFEKAIDMLNNGGYLGFITSNKYAIASYGEKLRKYILDHCRIVCIVDVSHLGVFKDALTYPYVIILQKTNMKVSSNKIKIKSIDNESQINDSNYQVIDQKSYANNPGYIFTLKMKSNISNMMDANSVKLGEIATIKETIHTGNIREKLVVSEKIDSKCKKLLAGKDCHRYWYNWNNKYIRYDKAIIKRDKNEYANLCDSKYFEKPKILLREIAVNIESCYDDKKYYTLNKVYSLQIKGGQKYSYGYLLALLNSLLLSFYFRENYEEAHVGGDYLQFKKIYTSQLPIHKINFNDNREKKNHDDIAKLAIKMIDLSEKYNNIKAKQTAETVRLKSQIEDTDKEIDQLVYKLYGLTPAEIRVVEGEGIGE